MENTLKKKGTETSLDEAHINLIWAIMGHITGDTKKPSYFAVFMAHSTDTTALYELRNRRKLKHMMQRKLFWS
eukprot:4010774-Ditylum_brightwellii.AAC.1